MLKFESKTTQHDSNEESLGKSTSQGHKSVLGPIPWLVEAGRSDPIPQIPALSLALKITEGTCYTLPSLNTVTFL